MEWITRWAGSYTFISCSYWGPQYYFVLKKLLGIGFEHTLFIHKKGTVSFLVKQDELDALGNFLSKKVQKNKKETLAFLKKLKNNADLLMKKMQELEGKIMTQKEYASFMKLFSRHLAYHVFMKKTVDYLPQKTLKEMLPAFTDARVYSEPVYSKTEYFFRAFARAIEKKEHISAELLTCLTQMEIEEYLGSGKLPKQSDLQSRYEFSILFFEKGNQKLLTKEDANTFAQMLQQTPIDEIRGKSAHPGFARGRCRIISDPHAKVDFQYGDILVTGMTRPEFTVFYDKAAAIVTDVGGLLCHAAIIAMEMGKPCIVGTQSATKVFKDGEMIEVDADKGIVRKVK